MPFLTENQEQIEATGALVLASGEVYFGRGNGAKGTAIAEVCFNTAITGYQEILTDPSYASQMVVFTFPHIGNVGANDQDQEESSVNAEKAARGAIFRGTITPPSNWRAVDHFDAWLTKKGIVGLSGVDTRSITRLIREKGMVNGIIAHISPDETVSIADLKAELAGFAGMEGADLAKVVGPDAEYAHAEQNWKWDSGFTALESGDFHVVVLDFGVKKNILRNLSEVGARCTVLPGNATAEDVLALKPDGVVLSNGPGDPAATGVYAVPEIQKLIASDLPILGICLGHQSIGQAFGGDVVRARQVMHGKTSPVYHEGLGVFAGLNNPLTVTRYHSLVISRDTLPDCLELTAWTQHEDGSVDEIMGVRHREYMIEGVQFHPESILSEQGHEMLANFLKQQGGMRR